MPWTVVLPLKGGPGAKSRLGGPPALAEAIALDSLAAVLAAGQTGTVLVVTADTGLAQRCREAGAAAIGQSQQDGGLTAAIQDGVRNAPGGPCAVLLGDLPALTPQDLDEALQAAATALRDGTAMVAVPDAEGTGTVLLAAADPGRLVPRFGPGSAARHQQAGALLLALDLPRLRQDVDTPADLEAAVALGAGPRTREVLARAVA